MSNGTNVPPLLTFEACDQIVSAVRNGGVHFSKIPAHCVIQLSPVLLLRDHLNPTGRDDSFDDLLSSWPDAALHLGLARSFRRQEEVTQDEHGVFGCLGINKGAHDDEAMFRFKFRLEQAVKASGMTARGATLVALVGELMDNVKEHSGAPRTGSAGFYRGEKHMEVIVSDHGRGVLASLQQSSAYSALSSDLAAIELFTDEGVSRTDTPGRGFGFRELPRVVGDNFGYARFHSGRGALVVDGSDLDETSKMPIQVCHLPGLFCSLVFEATPIGGQLGLRL